MSRLLDASFKGVKFFVDGNEGLQKFGRNLVVTEYPNSKEQYAEDTGGFADSFEIDIFFVGEFAYEDFEAFRNAANEEGFGDLILPMQGEFNVKCGQCVPTIQPNKTSQYIQVSCAFFTSRNDAGFVDAPLDVQSVLSFASEFRKELAAFFNSSFFVAVNDALSTIAAITDIESMMHDLKYILKQTSSPMTEAFQKIEQIEQNIDYILDKNSIGNEISELFEIISNGYVTFETQESVSYFADAGSVYESNLSTQITNQSSAIGGQAYWPSDTQTRINRNATRELLTSFYQVNTLTLAYEMYPSTQLNTDIQSVELKNKLEQNFDKLFFGVENDAEGLPITDAVEVPDFLLSKDVFDGFNAVRLAAFQAQEASKSVKYKVEKIDTKQNVFADILGFTYAGLADIIKNEAELVEVAEALRKQNRRATYLVGGKLETLRRL
jgi:hypothetical protein